MAGVPLGDIHLRFTWQAWHLATSTFVLCGKRGTGCTWWRAWSPLVAGDAAALCAAGMALGDIYLRPCGRPGTWRHLLLFCVAGVLQVHLVARLVAVGRRWSPLVAVPRHFPWQAWHLATSIFVSCGRRGTWRHPPAFHVAGVALGDIYLRFAWQVCYRLHLVARLVAVGRRWSPVTPRHFAWQAWRLATSIYLRFMYTAGVPLGDIHLRFAWQAWHLATSTFVLCGRCGTGCTWSPLVAVGRRWSLVTPRHFAWQAWRLATCIFVSCGRRAT